MTKRVQYLLFGALGSLACTSAVETKTVAPKAPSPRRVSEKQPGQRKISVTQTWLDNCAKCHGDNAEGNGAGTHSLNTRDKFDQKWDRRFFDAIKNGIPEAGMEPMGETMQDNEIWAQVVHIRELQAKALRSQYGSPKPGAAGVFHSQRADFRIEEVIDDHSGLKTPWAIDWLPDGRMLVTNLPGALMVRGKDGKLTTVEGTPEVIQLGQGGLMDVTVHPNYAKNGWIYLSFADPKKDGSKQALTKIVRGKIRFEGDRATWTDQATIWEGDQKFYNGQGIHFGSRIVFDGKGHVLFSVGERGANMIAQRLDNPWGKVHRLNEDGSLPRDNPYVGTADADKSTWTWGHRNPQGLVYGLDGRLWDTEHAPRGGDEVNELVKGTNYGWPAVCFGINYNDSPFMTPWPTPDQNFGMPILRWLPSIGPCGLDVVRGSAFPGWRGDLMAGGLSGKNVDRIRTLNGKLIEREEIIQGQGRVREVATGPDGAIYVALNQPDKIIRLVPVP